ncbi:DNA-directed RNA polymerase II subunit 4 [Orobanche minor]
MSAEEEENAAELKIPDEFLKAKCLMNSEVSLILDHKYEQLQQMADDPMNQMSQVFEKSLQYVKRFSRYKNNDAVRQVREYPSLVYAKLAEFELCVLGNLCPETVEEAIAMVPSIKDAVRAFNASKGKKMVPTFEQLTEIIESDDPDLEKMYGGGPVRDKYYNQAQDDEVLDDWSQFVHSHLI